eukprot:jgi/Bigna1/127087/aug1.3_g1795
MQIEKSGFRNRDTRDNAPPKDKYPPAPQDLEDNEPREISNNCRHMSKRRNMSDGSGKIARKASHRRKRKFKSYSENPSIRHSSHTESGQSRDNRNQQSSYRNSFSTKRSGPTGSQSRDRIERKGGRNNGPLRSSIVRSNRDMKELDTQHRSNFESKFKFALYDELRRKTINEKDIPEPKDLIMFLAVHKGVHLQKVPRVLQERAQQRVQVTEPPSSQSNETPVPQTVVTPLSEVKEKAVIGIPADAKFQEACGAEETLKSNTSGDLLSKKSVRRSKKKVEDVLKVVLAMDREAMLLNLREQHLSSKGLKCFLVQRLVKALCVENVVTSQAKRTVGSCGVGGSRCR